MSDPGDFVFSGGWLTGYKGSGGDVVIPEGITSIQWGMFQGREDLNMATRIENTAAAPAMSQTCGSDPYSFENMLYYQTSLSLLRGMLEQECLDQKAYRKACRILAHRYGFPEKSILAEAA